MVCQVELIAVWWHNLLSKAIGKNLTCIFVNNGLLRKNEEIQVVNTFKKKLKMNLIYVNAEKEFIKNYQMFPILKKTKNYRKSIY